MESLALALVLGATLVAVACFPSTSDSFLGTQLRPKRVAADFTLHNQFQQPVSLSDRKGDVVVLTFIYSTCPDVCPLTAAQLRDALSFLEEYANHVSVIGVSVDPEGDSPASAREFIDKWELTNSLDFLLGDRTELASVWEDYHLAPGVLERNGNHAKVDTTAQGNPSRGSIDALKRESAKYLLVHSAPIYVIDREGFARSVFTLPFSTEDLVHDIRTLLE